MDYSGIPMYKKNFIEYSNLFITYTRNTQKTFKIHQHNTLAYYIKLTYLLRIMYMKNKDNIKCNTFYI